jgi:hypothetical protein
MKKLIPVLLLVLMPSVLLGFGYLDLQGSGSPLPGFTARSVALGGLRSMGLQDGSSVLTNPAGLAGNRGTTISISIGPGIGGATVLDSLGKSENNWLSLSTLFAGISLPLSPSLSIGAAVGKITDFSYDYTHYTYEFGIGQTGNLTEIHQLRVSGGMYESVGGLSYRMADWLDMGVSAGMRFGSASYDSSYTDKEDPDNDTTLTWQRDFSGFCWHGGIEIPLESAVIGFSWASEDDDYPARAAVGGRIYMDDEKKGAVGAEVEIGDPGDRNSTDIRLFGSAFLYEQLEIMGALRFGTPNYEQVDTENTLGVSLGTGVHLGSVELDAGFSWSSLGRDSLFLVPGQPDELKDSQILISFGFNWVL